MAETIINTGPFVVGGIYDTRNNGKVKILEVLENDKAKIVFINTGNTYIVVKSQLRYGKAGDKLRDKTKEFVDKCEAVHSNKYSYEKTMFIKCYLPVIVTCKEHGDFSILAQSHKRGARCPMCGMGRKRDLNKCFIEKSKTLFGDVLDYSMVEYKGTYEYVTLICREHGEFKVTPDQHYKNKTPCPKCSREQLAKDSSTPFDEFVQRSTEVHDGKYSYIEESYSKFSSFTDVVCPEHGKWSVRAYSHLLGGHGCPQCKVSRKKSLEEFVINSNDVHKNMYDYSLVEYVNSTTPVDIICKEHGLFKQTPSSHIHGGSGCPQCANYGFNPSPDIPAVVYILTSENMVKVGITNKTAKSRCNSVNMSSPEKFAVHASYQMSGQSAQEVEKEVLRVLRDAPIPRPLVRFEGHTETFMCSVETIESTIIKVLEG